MKSIQFSTPVFQRTALGIALVASLTACGGDSSSNRTKTLTLNEDTQFMAIGRFLSVFPESLDMLQGMAGMAIEVAGPLSECDPSSYELVEEPPAASITYRNCTAEEVDEDLADTYPSRETFSLHASGSVTVPDTTAGVPHITFQGFQFGISGLYEEWDDPITGNTPPAADYKEEYEVRFAADGSLIYDADAPSITTDRLTVQNLLLVGETEYGEVQPDAIDQNVRYTIRDLLYTPDTLELSITFAEQAGNLTTDIVMLEQVSFTSPYGCPGAGQLEWTDTKGNVMNVLFSGPQDVTITLNGVGTTYSCADYSDAIEPYIVMMGF